MHFRNSGNGRILLPSVAREAKLKRSAYGFRQNRPMGVGRAGPIGVPRRKRRAANGSGMDRTTSMSVRPAFSFRSRYIAFAAVVVAWGMFFAALSSDGWAPFSLTGGPGGKSGEQVVVTPSPTAGTGEPGETTGEAQKPDPLEKIATTFNIPELTMRRLSRVLAEEYKLQVRYPASAGSINLVALEQGGHPLGEILAGLLSPHDLLFVLQGDALEIVEAKLKRDERHDDSTGGTVLDTDARASLPVRPGEPAETWINAEPPVALRFLLQPLVGESDTPQAVLTVEGRREGHSWFRNEIRVAEGETVRVESKAEEWVWLTLRPTSLTEPLISLELRFHHEGIVSRP